MWLFVIAIIIGLGGLAMILGHKAASTSEGETGMIWGGVAVGFLAVILIFFSCVQTVSTKNVGIETSFGKVTGHLGNGFHLTAPWVTVTEMDAAIQTDTFSGDNQTQDGTNIAGGPCVNVRIANQQTACVDVSIRWRINPNAADSLYQNYRDFANVQNSLVKREISVAMNAQLSNYNPLNSISVAQVGTNYAPNPTLQVISNNVKNEMKRGIGGQIEILSVLIPIMHFDAATQNRLNQLQQQEAQTRIAIAAQQTNEQQAKANQSLAASVDNSTNVLVAQCMNTLQEMVKQGQQVPAGFSCWPGGSGTPVIANSGK